MQKCNNRRSFIKSCSFTLGGYFVSGFLPQDVYAYHLNFSQYPSKNTSKLFSSSQLNILAEICDTVIPQTKTPSAENVGVHHFINKQLLDCYSHIEQQHIISLIDSINKYSIEKYSTTFEKLPSLIRKEVLDLIEGESPMFYDSEKAAFPLLKHLIVYGYYTTEIGATEELTYQKFPGGFKGSISYRSIGRSYGSLAYY